MTITKEKQKYPLLIDTVAKKLFKNKNIGKEYTSRIISYILKEDYETIFNNIKLISEEISFSSKLINSKTDIMLEDNSILVDVEINYFNGPTRSIQMDSYVYQLFLNQITSYKKYSNVRKVIQIIIEDNDYFHKNDFVYNIAFMDKKHHLEENDNIERFRINLDYLSKLSYNNIRNDGLAYLLYPFVCGYDKLDIIYDDLYKDDEFMRKVIDEAKRITKDNTMKLYFPLTAEEVRKMDEEYFIKQGIEEGIEKGTLNTKYDIVMNMYNDNMPIKTIAKYLNLSTNEVEKIIKEKK